MRHATTALALLLLLFGGACDNDTRSDAGGGLDAGTDGGAAPLDAGADGGMDAGAGTDGGADAGSGDAGPPIDGGPAASHALISEIGLQPAGAELVEISNPGSTAIDLGDLYLSDNSGYHRITAGPWAPSGTPQTDWLVRFPAGATLAPGDAIVVALSPEYESVWGGCPDFIIDPTETGLVCGSATVPAMRIPTNGSVGTNVGSLLSNGGEMIVLFTWDGSAATVRDVDYVTFDPDLDANTHVDKTGVAGYAPDTAETSQIPAPLPAAGQTIERCDATEPSETRTGGNGVDGHDETSEDLSASFRATSSPTPGAPNPCP